jgi:hypothetical protein
MIVVGVDGGTTKTFVQVEDITTQLTDEETYRSFISQLERFGINILFPSTNA